MRLSEGERAVFARPPRMSVSEWAVRHLIVPDGPYAGARYRRDVNPYLVGIMDAWGDPRVEEVLVCGAPQTGKTLAMDACLAYAVDRRPGPRMLAMPDDDSAAKVVEAKLKPLLKRTRPTGRKLRGIRAGKILFPDGAIYISSAAAASDRATISVKDLFLDEEGLYRSIAGQGDPLTDFKERTRSYAYARKIMRVSKPIGGEESSIWRDLSTMDELREYHVICPACGVRQTMREEHVITVDNVRDPVRVRRERLGRYRCPHCRYHWTDYARDMAVSRGEWLAAQPDAGTRSMGFYLPAILSSAVSLSEVAAARLAAQASDDPALIQAYENGIWARPYKPVISATSADTVMALRDADLAPRVLPAGYVALTAGIDMQRRGFFYVVCAWSADMDCALVDYGRLYDWAEVERFCFGGLYPAEGDGGGEVPLWRAAIDTGGTAGEDSEALTRGEECYGFVAEHGEELLLATKGNAHAQTPPVRWTMLERLPRSRQSIRNGLRLYMLDTDYFKRLVTAHLSPDARQPLRLHRDCGEDLARQLTAEELVRDASGRQRWRRKHRDNHYFDALCMATACVHPSWTPGLGRVLEHLNAREDASELPAPDERSARRFAW